jgi:hypothetical protein
MTAPGAGFCLAGFSPAGFGDIEDAPAPATDNLVDEHGVQQTARAIDPVTGQYILRSTGRFLGMPRTRQLVLIAIKTVLNSSALKGFGLEEIGGDNDALATRRLEAKLRAALDHLVTKGLIEIVAVPTVGDTPTRIRGALKWLDLATNQVFEEPT